MADDVLALQDYRAGHPYAGWTAVPQLQQGGDAMIARVLRALRTYRQLHATWRCAWIMAKR